jgi:A/G-specific adenine glycosylase
LTNLPVDEIRRDLLQWWEHGKRHYPWRESRDPYEVLVAEVLLHRTRADQVVPLYKAFLRYFPDPASLARSTPDELSELLRSAGLRWRWKLLHAMAIQLTETFDGQVPERFEMLVSLPGISHYIASAVRCFAFGKPDVLLDTNTVRVSGRLLGLAITDSSRRSRLFRTILEQLIDQAHPREFNLALIDLGARVCRSSSPLHDKCCLKNHCTHYTTRTINEQKNKAL